MTKHTPSPGRGHSEHHAESIQFFLPLLGTVAASGARNLTEYALSWPFLKIET
jgi:hypothetical protein